MKQQLLIIGVIIMSFLLVSDGAKAFETNNTFYKDGQVAGLPQNLPAFAPGSFHFITHGRPGQLLIQGRWHNAAGIVQFIRQKQLLSPHISQLNIYGCEFAKGVQGQAAVKYIEAQLQLAVAASTNITGAGGDYILETRNVNAAPLFAGFTGSLQCSGTAGGTGPNDDFDKDGICNGVDLDDDNDGILDATEKQCGEASLNAAGYTNGGATSTTTSVNGTTITTGFSTTKSSTSLSSYYPDGDAGGVLISRFSSSQNDTAAYYYITELNFSKPVKVRLMYPGEAAAGVHGYTDIFNLITPGSATSFQYFNPDNAFTILQNTPGSFRYYPNTSGNGTELAASRQGYYVETSEPVTRVQIKVANTNSSGNNNAAIKVIIEVCEGADVDGDGIPNELDLDSDGDGASDAYESGVPGATNNSGSYTDSVVVNPSSPGAAVGANGYANNLETAADSGEPNFTDTYDAYAVSPSVNAGADSDKDGIRDVDDIDDDNDGILDLREGGCAGASSTGGIWTYNNNSSPKTATYDFGNGIFAKVSTVSAKNFVSGMFNNQSFWSEPVGNTRSLQQQYNFGETITISFEDASGNPVVVNKPILHLDRVGEYTYYYEYYEYDDGDYYYKYYYYQNSARLELQNGLTWTKLAGASDFASTGTTIKDGGAGTSTKASYSTESGNDDTYSSAAGSLQIDQAVSTIVMTINQDGLYGDGLDAIELILSNICPVNESDTDEDGVPNRLDLDSDDDGASDAYESGVPGATNNSGSYTDSVVVNPSSPGAAVGANGYANNLETTADSGEPNFTDTYNAYAKSASVNAGVDTDKDGIRDVDDIDDDNDGILDVREGGSGECGTQANPFTSLEQARANVITAGMYYFNLSGNTFTTYVDDNGYVLVAVDYGDGYSALPASTSLGLDKAANGRGILNPATLAALGSVEQLRISSNTTSAGGVDVTSTDAELISRVKASRTLHRGGTEDNSYNESWTGTGESFLKFDANTTSGDIDDLSEVVITIYSNSTSFNWRPNWGYQRVSWSYGEIGSTDYFALWVKGNSSGMPCNIAADADEDGIPNGLDLDSDGDGCYDAYESGVPGATKNTGNYTDSVAVNPATPTTGVGANGYSNSFETAADNGKPTFTNTYNNYALSASQNTCADTDGDGIGDLTDIDDDNDGILDSIENGGQGGGECGTAANPFTSLEQARANVTTPGIYYFNLSGNSFATYVDANGYVLVAADYGDGTGALPVSDSLGLDKAANGRGILNPATLAALGTIEQLRISSNTSILGGVDVTSTDAELINRVKANRTLNKGGSEDHGYNESWTGTGEGYLKKESHGYSVATDNLSEIIITISGASAAFTWEPVNSYQRVCRSNGEIGDKDYFALWVRGDGSGTPCPEEVEADTDADDDGIPNRLDLDSDGDGCPDVVEAGVPGATIGTGNYTDSVAVNPASGSAEVGANGYKNNLETAADNGTPAFTNTYNDYALDGLKNTCIDTDGDGVGDVIDIDDDNDGILDNVEAASCGTSESNPFTSLEQARASVGAPGIYYFNLSGNTFKTYVDANGYVLVAVDYGDGSGTLPASDSLGLDKAANGRGILNSTLLAALGAVEQLRISSNTTSAEGLDVISDNLELISRVKASKTLHKGGTEDNGYNESWFGTGQTYLRADGSSSGTVNNLAERIITIGGNTSSFSWVPSTGNQRVNWSAGEIGNNEYFALWVRGNNQGVSCGGNTDTDDDGIPNQLDLDSDGDGCSDASEAEIEGTLRPAIMQNKNRPSYSPAAIAEGGYGANGFADAIETAPESGIYKGSYARYSDALNDTIHACDDLPPVRLRDSSTSVVTTAPRAEGGKTTVYPNPSQGMFIVRGAKEEISTIVIFNAAVANITRQVQMVRISDEKVQVNMTSLPNGIYYLKTNTKGFKIIKR